MSDFEFADTSSKRYGDSFNKPIYMKLTQGMYTLRVLNSQAKSVYTHWINNGSIKCLDDECPQCEQNKKIRLENPDNYKDVKGYSAFSKRFFVNVLDKTLVKVCPETTCQGEVTQITNRQGAQVFPSTCPKCGTFLQDIEAAPSNKVKILSKGVELFDQLEIWAKTVLNEKGERRGITNFDLVINVPGVGKKPVATLSAASDAFEVISIPEDALFDLDNCIITLTVSEMKDTMRGVSLKDIFAARKAQKEVLQQKSVEVSSRNMKDLETEIINDLFAGG